jgi:hypothetical protein
MRVIALLLPLALLATCSAQAADCTPRNLSEYFKCQKIDEAKRVLAVFKAAGETSSYWPCLNKEVAAAGKRAEAAKNLIDTSEELTKVIIDAQVACKTHFSAFAVALRKEAEDQGYSDDISDPDQLEFLVYQLWFTALAAS